MSGFIEQERYTCAIGALQTVVAIPRAVPILHSGPGCGTMIGGFFERATGYAGGNTMPCTNFAEKDVVFGGVNKLRKIVENTYKILDTDLQVILSGCTAGITGDDIGSVAEEFKDQGKPIVYLDTPGFKMNNYRSHNEVINAIINQYVSEYEDANPARSRKNLVNLFASIPYQDIFWKENLKEYKRLLEGIGLEVNILFGPFSNGVKEWQTIPSANFNILVSPWYGEPVVENLKTRYDQPYYKFGYVPIGGNETTKFLKGVVEFAKANGAEIDEKKAEAFYLREESAFYEEIDNLTTFITEFRYGLPGHVHIIGDSGYVIGLSKFLLTETGIIPKEQFIVDNTPKKYQQEIADELAGISAKRDIPVSFDPDAGKAQKTILALDHTRRGLIIGSGWDRDLAKKTNCDFVGAFAPVQYRLTLSTNWVGYTGGLHVIEDIYNTVLSSYQ